MHLANVRHPVAFACPRCLIRLPGPALPCSSAQAFLSMFWHVEWMLEAGVQAAMLAVVIRENDAICASPASASWLAGRPAHLSLSLPPASVPS